MSKSPPPSQSCSFQVEKSPPGSAGQRAWRHPEALSRRQTLTTSCISLQTQPLPCAASLAPRPGLTAQGIPWEGFPAQAAGEHDLLLAPALLHKHLIARSAYLQSLLLGAEQDTLL